MPAMGRFAGAEFHLSIRIAAPRPTLYAKFVATSAYWSLGWPFGPSGAVMPLVTCAMP